MCGQVSNAGCLDRFNATVVPNRDLNLQLLGTIFAVVS